MSDSGGARILVVDDDPAIRRIVADRFRAGGYEVASAENGAEALARIERFEPHLLLLDLRMPGLDGFGVLEAVRSSASPPEVLVVTAHGSIESAVRAIRMGAADFVAKPFDTAHLEHVVRRTLEARRLRRRLECVETEISSRHALVLGTSEAMRRAVDVAVRAASSDATILLLGESGSGKEVFARTIHARSRRAGAPFVAVNCAALSAELLESELFGHEKGAFTGAVRSKPGRIETAAGGTLFLDEIAELAPVLQAKLLRVLQEREFERVGGTRTIRADVRLIAATHQDLSQRIASERFREDLFYRLNVVSIRVPALRERTEDLPPLIEHLLARHAHEAGRARMQIDEPARALLRAYSWPGNVRELGNVIERAVVLADSDTLHVEDLPEEIRDGGAGDDELSHPLKGFHDAVRESKRRIISEALERTGGHQTQAAQLLGLTQPYLARLIKTLGLQEAVRARRKPAR